MPNTNYQTIHQMGSAVNDIIRQASGRDEVQNIDMDFVTVARNHCAVHEEYSGSEVSFEAQTVTPMGLIVQVNPVQDLHGYANPWPGGGGKNKLPPELVQGTATATSITTGDTTRVRSAEKVKVVGGSSYIVSWETPTDAIVNISYYDDSETETRLGVIAGVSNGNTVTIPSEASYVIIVFAPSPDTRPLYVSEFSNIMLRLSTETDATFAPYSNICPITGWTGANVTLSPTTDPDDPDKEVYAYTFPTEAGTVYGGTLTVNKDGTGTLVVDRASIVVDENTIIANYSPGRGAYTVNATGHVSPVATAIDKINCDKLKTVPRTQQIPGYTFQIAGSDANSPNILFQLSPQYDTIDKCRAWLEVNNLHIVYPLATPVTYTLSNLEVINTLKGTNNVFADTGDITVQFTDIVEDY